MKDGPVTAHAMIRMRAANPRTTVQYGLRDACTLPHPSRMTRRYAPFSPEA